MVNASILCSFKTRERGKDKLTINIYEYEQLLHSIKLLYNLYFSLLLYVVFSYVLFGCFILFYFIFLLFRTNGLKYIYICLLLGFFNHFFFVLSSTYNLKQKYTNNNNLFIHLIANDDDAKASFETLKKKKKKKTI